MLKRMTTSKVLKVSSWNIAAINNNPFEYWVTYDDPGYNKLMQDVQDFINAPGDLDVEAHQVITDDMMHELQTHLEAQSWPGVVDAIDIWNKDLKSRHVVSQVLKDHQLGAKRLMSMPDRITNTINLADGTKLFRPTPINCYSGHFSNFEDWWKKWLTFMFDTPVEIAKVKKSDDGTCVDVTEQKKNVASLLVPVKKAKYPAITEEEERISLPLQTICAALFDAILVDMLEKVAPTAREEHGEKSWQTLRGELALALNSQKESTTLQLLSSVYHEQDVIFLQEVANSFVDLAAKTDIPNAFTIVTPPQATGRDQNSLVLLSKSKFDATSVEHATEEIMATFDKNVPVAFGDLVAVKAKGLDGVDYLLASFHGDTNGLATIPVVEAVHKYATETLGSSHRLIFGLDANTYEKGVPGKKQDMTEFAEYFASKNMSSCWGDKPDPRNYTTYNARTFLQTQLNKASSKEDFVKKGDVNPKDFILFYTQDFAGVENTYKDNTGKKEYVEEMAFPTLSFPSDHAIISTTILPAE